MLQSRIGYSVHNLAQELEVSPRTIYRDLRLLAEAGIPTFYDVNKRGHILQHHIHTRTSGLSDEEITSLLLAAHIFSLSCAREVSSPILQAISKLLAQLPPCLREEVTCLLSLIEGKPFQTLWPGGSQPVVAEILAALRQKRPIRIIYRSAKKSTPSLCTKITSHRLVAHQKRWYLVGRSSWHRKIIRFDLRHIQHAEQTENSTDPVESSYNQARPPRRPLTTTNPR